MNNNVEFLFLINNEGVTKTLFKKYFDKKHFGNYL